MHVQIRHQFSYRCSKGLNSYGIVYQFLAIVECKEKLTILKMQITRNLSKKELI